MSDLFCRSVSSGLLSFLSHLESTFQKGGNERDKGGGRRNAQFLGHTHTDRHTDGQRFILRWCPPKNDSYPIRMPDMDPKKDQISGSSFSGPSNVYQSKQRF